MTLVSDGSWIGIDDTAELKIFPATGPDFGVAFWLCGFLVLNGEQVDDVPRTVQTWVEWHRANPNLEVSASTPKKIGELPAMTIDIELSDSAVNEAPDCLAAACVDIWGFPQLGNNGIAGDDVYRVYLADVDYNGTDHLFIAT